MSSISFGKVADQFMARARMNHSQQWLQTTERLLQRDVLTLWGGKPITDIVRRDGIQLVTSIATRAPHQAAAASRVIRGIFEFAYDEGYIVGNPMCRLTKYIPKAKSKAHRRVLSPMEIKTVWLAISKGPGDEACKRALKLALATGQRLSAIVGMHRGEINGECWAIPPERCHWRSDSHRVYLSPLALDLIGDGEGYIFPSADPSRPIRVDAVARLFSAKGPKKTPYCGLAPWVSSDLRRTVAHQMVMLGVSHEAVGAVLGHTQRNSLCGLNPTFHPEVKAALLKWEAELQQLVENKPTAVRPPAPCLTLPTFGL